MKIYSYLFPFIISCFFVSGSFAATEEKSYGPEQEYTAHFGQSLAVCTSQGLGDCPSGERCGVGGSNTSCIEARCQKCSEKPGGGYDYSDSGAYNREGCFKYCVPEDVKVDGETVGQKEPSVLSVCYPSLCPENDLIYCKNESDECNGYHAENGTCVSNVQPCEGEAGKGFQLWDYDKQDWTECRLTECEEGFHLEPTVESMEGGLEYGFACDGKTIYGKCVSNNRNCSDYFGTSCKNNDKSGTVGGKPSWSDKLDIGDSGWRDDWEKTVSIAGGGWDFGECYCEIEGVETGAGTATQHCFWGDSGPWGEGVVWSGGCETESFTKCAAGNCDIDNSGICNTAPAGYFGDGTMMACQPCPMGATSPVGSKGENCCYMSADKNLSTRFCDGVGCFNLSELTNGNKVPYDNTTCYTVYD